MRTLTSIIAIAAATGLTASVAAQDREAEFHALIEANTHRIAWDGEQLTGAGAEWLASEIEVAHYFMIGERHATADVPEIAAHLFELAAADGYSHAVLEMGPIMGAELNSFLEANGADALAGALQDPVFRDAMALLSMEEEQEFVADAYRAGLQIAGLDQEFILSGEYHLRRLEAGVQTDAQLDAVNALRTVAEGEQYFVGAADPALYEALEAAFAGHADSGLADTAEALRITNAIYRPFLVGGPTSWSNVERENYVKTNWYWMNQELAAPGEPGPRMTFKWGGLHSGPSIDSHARISLGTFIEDWATVHGVTSFNLGMDCNAGESLSTGGMEHVPQACVSWFLSAGGGQNATAGADDQTFSRHLQGVEEIVLIDFRPVRERLREWRFLSQGERNMIAGYDVYMAIPGTRTATMAGSE
ncbi:hypothetical protein [Maricaulis sp. MIT060901]|uniref:hypothetical protein n=1 Tax=Maricaulis sp. MIT060901 TaxID=3096993 RepID=UPI00399A9E47